MQNKFLQPELYILDRSEENIRQNKALSVIPKIIIWGYCITIYGIGTGKY
jgi:hypothetical protein